MPIAPTQGSSSGGAGSDGWTVSTDTWVYASASTFTIAGADRTVQLAPGTLIKLTNSTVKYFVVTTVAFSTNTTVTVTGGSDYALANAAITSPYYSYQASPQGYPDVFAYAPTAGGVSSPSNNCYFKAVGRVCTVWFHVSGTSTAATFDFTAPIKSATHGNMFGLSAAIAVNNGTITTTPARVQIGSNSTQIDAGKDYSQGTGGWTASGAKEIDGVISYPF